MLVSVDGYFEGPNHDISWHMVDDEFDRLAIEQLKQMGTLLLGRKTYQLFEGFWPNAKNDPSMSKEDREIGRMLDEMPKIAFSRQGLTTTWQNTRVVSDHSKEEVTKLKEQPGKDIIIFGSNNLCVSLMGDGLIDEFRIMVNPIALGKGSSLFTGLQDKLNLKLASTREFMNGNILLTYQPR